MKRLLIWIAISALYVVAMAAVATIPAAGQGFLGIVFWFFLGYCSFILLPQMFSAIIDAYGKTGADVKDAEISKEGAAS